MTYLYSAYNKSSKRFTIKLILESQYKTIYKKIYVVVQYISISMDIFHFSSIKKWLGLLFINNSWKLISQTFAQPKDTKHLLEFWCSLLHDGVCFSISDKLILIRKGMFALDSSCFLLHHCMGLKLTTCSIPLYSPSVFSRMVTRLTSLYAVGYPSIDRQGLTLAYRLKILSETG